jgi:hypothetical protein
MDPVETLGPKGSNASLSHATEVARARKCETEGVVGDEAARGGLEGRDGNPLDLIEREATAHDLVVVGNTSSFDVEGEPDEVPLCIDHAASQGLLRSWRACAMRARWHYAPALPGTDTNL